MPERSGSVARTVRVQTAWVLVWCWLRAWLCVWCAWVEQIDSSRHPDVLQLQRGRLQRHIYIYVHTRAQ